jgi:hypothetical protein
MQKRKIVCWGFSPCIGFPQGKGICVVDVHAYVSTWLLLFNYDFVLLKGIKLESK